LKTPFLYDAESIRPLSWSTLSLSAQVLRRVGLEAPEAAAHERRAAERRAEFRLLHREPPFGRERQGIEQRIERRMKMQRRTEVVGAAALAGVAAENPPRGRLTSTTGRSVP